MTTIVTVTPNPALDVCAEVPTVEADHKLHCAHADRTPGGGGINVARAIHRLGGAATAIFPFGGSTGALLCDLLAGEGVPIVGVPVASTTREDFSVRETTTGHEYRFVLPGLPLDPSEVARCIEEVVQHAHPGSFVVISGSMPPGVDTDAIEAIVGPLRAAGSHLVVDTSGPALTTFARLGVHLLKPSLHELVNHAGRELTAMDDIIDAANDLRRSGPNIAVVVSLGADGAVVVTDFQPPCVVETPPIPVVSAVGAGDSLVAGLVFGLAHGEALIDATRRGVAAGSAATMSAGHHLCRAPDVELLLPDVRATPLETGRIAASP